MIYLDMDGVIADFFTEVAYRFDVDHWKSIQDKEVKFAQLANTDFFYRIPCFYDDDGSNLSAKIVDLVKFYAWEEDIKWGICSSPMRGDEYNSAYHKRNWLEKTGFAPMLIEDIIFTSNKHKYAYSKMDGKPNILIDDKPENIKRFESAGGIGIRFQANEDDLGYLRENLFRAVETRKYA
jgi:5'(3')-deoxyribonucleotidase